MARVLAVALLLGLVSVAAAADLPDPKLTPGAVTTLTLPEICSRHWGRDHRHVTPAMKREVLAKYPGTKCRPDKHGRRVEIDHLISRELGGADAVDNLWKQCYAGEWNATQKDKLENRLHKEVCAGRLGLEEARAKIRMNWISVYREFYP